MPLYRQSFVDCPGLAERLLDLISLVFRGFRESLETATRCGLLWEEVSTPFVRFEAGRPVSHVGVLEMPLVLDGHEVAVGGVHAVCTHPEFRRRGYYRSVMEEALGWCDQRYETLILTTDQPWLYEAFGFRVVAEHRFVGTWSEAVPLPSSTTGRWRELSLDDAGSLDRLHRLLMERAPVSRRLGVVREMPVFLFNEMSRPLQYLHEQDWVAAFQVENTTLRLFDIAARQMPALREIISRVGQPVQRIEVYFAPDQLDADLSPEPHTLGGDDYLLVRGPFLPPQSQIMLPRSARA